MLWRLKSEGAESSGWHLLRPLEVVFPSHTGGLYMCSCPDLLLQGAQLHRDIQPASSNLTTPLQTRMESPPPEILTGFVCTEHAGVLKPLCGIQQGQVGKNQAGSPDSGKELGFYWPMEGFRQETCAVRLTLCRPSVG